MRRAVLRESFLNRGGRATPPRGCRYAMLGAIRRTGCSFVFRFVFKPSHPLSPPPVLRARRRGGEGGLDKRLIQTIIVDSRLEIHPADASSFFC